MSSSILYISIKLSLPIFSMGFFFWAVPVCSNSSTAVVCTSMLSLSIRTGSIAKHSTAQSSHLCTKQQTKYVPIRLRIKRCKQIPGICMSRSFYFPEAWSSWHLQVACLHLSRSTIFLLHLSCYFISFFLVSMRSWRNSPLGEAPCNTYDQWNTADIIASK